MAKRSTKQQLLLSAISLLLCVSMLVGSTFAWFTDSVTSTNNIIKSGTLDILLEYSTDFSNWYEVTSDTNVFKKDALWEPGYTEVIYLRASNVGTLDLKYNLGINVASETAGTNVAKETFYLSDYINFGVIENVDSAYADRDAARAAVTKSAAIKSGYAQSGKLLDKDSTNVADKVKTMAVVVYMPETVGNEANYRIFDANTDKAPVVNLGINLFATQVESEVDSFDENYDAGSAYSDIQYVDGASAYSFEINDAQGYNLASAEVPSGAVASDAEAVKVSVTKETYAGNITVAADQTVESFEVTVTGLKDGNTTPVKVKLRIPAGLKPETVKLYHYDDPINSTYNPNTGYVTFESATFSPFTVVYDAESEYVPEEIPTPEQGKLPDGIPVATVVEYTDTDNIEWGNYGQWSPTEGLEANLEAAYVFKCPDNVSDKFDYWYCDFYVSLDKDLGANQIFLGGNYGSFGWVGFHNGDLTLDAKTELPLLGSVTSNPWTYADIKNYVGEFICGVGDVNDALADATFTVKLRLTNPENENEHYDVNTVTHTFAKTASTAQELVDAMNNNNNVALGGDIDLNDLFN